MTIGMGTLSVLALSGGFGAFWLILAGLVRPWGFAQTKIQQLSLEERCANSKWETPQSPSLSGAGI